MLHLWHVVSAFALLLLQARALEFAFTTFSCNEVRFTYALDQNTWERQANVLLINYRDETIAAVDINSPSGTGSFDPTVITEAARYDFTVALGSDACDVFATDGACFEAGRNQLYALTISQQATCDGEGTGDADATSNLPADGAQSSEADEADNQALNSAVVPDDIAHTAGAVTVSVGSAEASSTGSGAQTATPTSSAAPTTATLIPLPLSSTAPAANAASARAGWSGAAVLAALVLAAAV